MDAALCPPPFEHGICGWACHATGGAVSGLTWSVLFSAGLILVGGLLVRRQLAVANGGVIPDEGFSLRNVMELLTDMLVGLARDNMGPKWRSYFPLIGTIFFFVLFSNLFGLVPGIDGATSSANTTWAWAVISFVAHQYVGIKENGWHYVYHFMGPVMFDLTIAGTTFQVRLLAPLYAVLEMIGHLSRIFTLAIRLLANMFADHTVVAVWITLVPIAIPAVFMALGALVAVLQAFVFSLLTMIYISLAQEDSH